MRLPSFQTFDDQSIQRQVKNRWAMPGLIVIDQQCFVHELIALVRDVMLYKLRALRELEALHGLDSSNTQLLIDPETSDLCERSGSHRHVSDGRIKRLLRPFGSQVLLFSTCADRKLMQRFLRLGASGYVDKNATSAQLFERLDVLWSRQHIQRPLNRCSSDRSPGYLKPETLGIGPRTLGIRPREILSSRQPRSRHLSPRQYEVLRLLEQGHPNKRISDELGLSLSTVKTHVSAILKAFGAANRAQAAFKASASGL